jgi:hypothetical protein
MKKESLKVDYLKFKDEIKTRTITRLVHFTPIINLINILEYGSLLSRSKLRVLSEQSPDLHIEDCIEINDKLRLDKMETHINFSIEHPNHFLFNRFRKSYREWFVNWCVITISHKFILRKGTLFSIGNAASNYSKEHGINGSFETFLSLFHSEIITSNFHNARTIRRNNIAKCYPTDVQAEVLIPDEVLISEIQEVIFNNEDDLRSTKAAVSVLGCRELPSFKVDKLLFKERGI